MSPLPGQKKKTAQVRIQSEVVWQYPYIQHVFLPVQVSPPTEPLHVPVAKIHDSVFVPQAFLADADRPHDVQRAWRQPMRRTSEVRSFYPVVPKPTVYTIREPFLRPIDGAPFFFPNTPLVSLLPVSTRRVVWYYPTIHGET